MPAKRCTLCARDAEEGSELCCDACGYWKSGTHSMECNKRTFPDWDGAQYLDDAAAAVHIVERLQKALSLAHVLGQEMRNIEAAGRRFIPNWPMTVDSMVNHLALDISYLEMAARKLMGK